LSLHWRAVLMSMLSAISSNEFFSLQLFLFHLCTKEAKKKKDLTICLAWSNND
jgi:hypothetical protein